MLVEGHRSGQSSSAPPIAVGSREATADGGIDHQQLHASCEPTIQQRPVYPRPPLGDRERARHSYANAGQRTIRQRETSASSDKEPGTYVERAGGQYVNWEQDNEEEPTSRVDAESLSHLHIPRQRTIAGEEGAAGSELMEEEDEVRVSTVVLSSTVLLNSRGRARTPTVLMAPVDGSYVSASASAQRIAGQDGADGWESRLSPRPQTAQGTRDIYRPAWHGEPAVSSFYPAKDLLQMPPDNDIRLHVKSMVSGVVEVPSLCWISRVWKHDFVVFIETITQCILSNLVMQNHADLECRRAFICFCAGRTLS